MAGTDVALRALVDASEAMGFRARLNHDGIERAIARGEAKLHVHQQAVALVYKPHQLIRFVPHAPPDVAGHYWLCAVHVPTELRRQGLGRKLVRQILAEHDAVYLECIGDERLAFFRSCGLAVEAYAASHGLHHVILLRGSFRVRRARSCRCTRCPRPARRRTAHF